MFPSLTGTRSSPGDVFVCKHTRKPSVASLFLAHLVVLVVKRALAVCTRHLTMVQYARSTSIAQFSVMSQCVRTTTTTSPIPYVFLMLTHSGTPQVTATFEWPTRAPLLRTTPRCRFTGFTARKWDVSTSRMTPRCSHQATMLPLRYGTLAT